MGRRWSCREHDGSSGRVAVTRAAAAGAAAGRSQEVYGAGVAPEGVAPDRRRPRWTARLALVVSGLALLAASVAAAPAAAHAETGGEAVAWGYNRYGQLGAGYKTMSGGGEQNPVSVTGLSEVTAIASGQASSLRGFAIALLSNGTVEAWGRNAYGELGQDEGFSGESCADSVEEGEPEPEEEALEGGKVLVKGVKGVTAISAANAYDLALLSNGTVETWGINQDGEHGNEKGGSECETGEANSDPAVVKNLSDVEAIASGGGADYALVNNAGTTEVKAWGRDLEGTLGVEEPSKEQTHEENKYIEKYWDKEKEEREYDKKHGITPLAKVNEMPERRCHTEIGNQSCSKKPRTVVVLPKEVTEKGAKAHITAISAGTTFALALYSNGTVRAWGSDGASQLGNNGAGGTGNDEPGSAIKVPGLGEGETFGRAVAIAAGKGEPGQGLALLANGKVVGWGNDNYGQVGPSTETCKTHGTEVPCVKTPKEIAGLEDITAISAGVGYSLALNANGEMYSFGLNENYRLGTGSTAESSDVPTLITGIGAVSTIAAGEISGYATLRNGVAAPAPLLTLTAGVESLTATWTFNPEPGKYIHVCVHLTTVECSSNKKVEGVKSYTFTGLSAGVEYVVDVENGDKRRAITGTPLP